jgi:putative endonuclease
MTVTRLDLGRTGEAAALAAYETRGYQLVARNWRCRLGEIDLVVRRGDLLVFCEVKARRGGRFGAPFEAVHVSKQRKLRNLAEVFLTSVGGPVSEVRFDVASVTVVGGRSRVHVFEDAF